MSKELQYKIKIRKYFDIDKEQEVTNYYVKQKYLLGWRYETEVSSDDGWSAMFFGTLFLDSLIVFLLLIFSEIIIHRTDILNWTNFSSIVLFFRFVWWWGIDYFMKKDFKSKENALSFIKEKIRKSNLEEYSSEQDIKITYKEGKIEIEQ